MALYTFERELDLSRDSIEFSAPAGSRILRVKTGWPSLHPMLVLEGDDGVTLVTRRILIRRVRFDAVEYAEFSVSRDDVRYIIEDAGEL